MNTWKKKGILIAVLTIMLGVIAVLIKRITINKDEMLREVEAQKESANRNIRLFHIMSEWMKTKGNNRTVADYLAERGYHTIAIYGMGQMGDCLLNELRQSAVTVRYAIDKNAEKIYTCVDLYKPNEEIPDVDVIVSTDLSDPRNIRKQLKCKKECPILSLEEIIMDM